MSELTYKKISDILDENDRMLQELTKKSAELKHTVDKFNKGQKESPLLLKLEKSAKDLRSELSELMDGLGETVSDAKNIVKGKVTSVTKKAANTVRRALGRQTGHLVSGSNVNHRVVKSINSMSNSSNNNNNNKGSNKGNNTKIRTFANVMREKYGIKRVNTPRVRDLGNRARDFQKAVAKLTFLEKK